MERYAVARGVSERARAIRQLEKRIFFTPVACPTCGNPLKVERVGKGYIVPDAAAMVDHGCCKKCVK